jgi:hypothetical protein
MKKGSAPGIPFRGYVCVHSLRPDDSLTILSMASSIGFRDSVSFLLTIQATGLLTFTLVGLSPLNTPAFAGHTNMPVYPGAPRQNSFPIMEIAFPLELDVDCKRSVELGVATVPTLFLLDDEGRVARQEPGFDKTVLNGVGGRVRSRAGVRCCYLPQR